MSSWPKCTELKYGYSWVNLATQNGIVALGRKGVNIVLGKKFCLFLRIWWKLKSKIVVVISWVEKINSWVIILLALIYQRNVYKNPFFSPWLIFFIKKASLCAKCVCAFFSKSYDIWRLKFWSVLIWCFWYWYVSMRCLEQVFYEITKTF